MIPTLLLFLMAGQDYRYWVQACGTAAETARSGCEAGDAELAVWSLEAWEQASGGLLRLTATSDREKAHIRIYWAGAREGLYGEARPILVDGKRGAEVYVRPAEKQADALMRTTVVYLTCLHETGHALGLAHTANFEDIMYNFQYGGDIGEYFGRYRRRLQARGDARKVSGMSRVDRERLAALLGAAQ